MKNERYLLYPGDFFLFDLKDNHICTHQPDNPLSVFTVYFDYPGLTFTKRLIRHNTLLYLAVQQICLYMENHESQAASVWLEAVLSAFSTAQEKNVPIPPAVVSSCHYIEKHIADSISLEDLTRHSGYSANQLLRLFHQNLGCTPIQYHTQKRIEAAKKLLIYSSQSITEISDSLGFCDCSYFTKVFKTQVGCTPKDFRCTFYNE